MKEIIIVSGLLLSTMQTHAQGELPPVTFAAGTNVCDPVPWKLVLIDNFDGTTLKQPWITFHSWNGMPGGDNELWGGARCVPPYNAISLDKNVYVSNGTAKIQVRKEKASWSCDTCLKKYNTNYTNGFLRLPYTKHFNAGKFEARIKMPVFKYAHSNFWLWMGRDIDEIDIAEAYGTSGNPPSALFGYAPTIDYSIHSWEPTGALSTNPYNLPHVEISNRYPNQKWYHGLFGRYFNQNTFHTYSCIWDTAIVSFYLDGDLVSEQWKYYQEKSYTKWWNPFYTYHYKVGSTCKPDAGTWKILPGFPYNNQSESALNFSTGIDKEDGSHPNGLVGEMEIDYVKIWQRHPDNGWHDLCDPALSEITGPNLVCSTATFNAIPPSPGGYWKTSPNLSVLSGNSGSVTVSGNNSTSDYNGYVYYYALDPNCPNTAGHFLKWKAVDAGGAAASTILAVETHNATTRIMHYNLHADPNYHGAGTPLSTYNSPTTFEWDIDYGPNLSLHHHVFGQFVSTPDFSYAGNTMKTLRWTVKITNGCGTVTQTDMMGFNYFKPARVEGSNTDTNNKYAVANITDMTAYEAAVQQRVYQQTMPLGSDDIAISSMIERIELEELAPYIVSDNDTVSLPAQKSAQTGNPEEQTVPVKVSPNPTNGLVAVQIGGSFDPGKEVQINIYDLTGRLQQHTRAGYRPGKAVILDLGELPDAMYHIEIRQHHTAAHCRVLKTN